MISVDNLAKTFTLHTLGGKRLAACHGVSFRVAHGNFLGLSGPSGAGKSTVLKCLYRTYLPESGAIHYHRAGFGEVDLGRAIVVVALEVDHEARVDVVSRFLEQVRRNGAVYAAGESYEDLLAVF